MALFVGAALADAGGTVLNRLANLVTRTISVNAVHYATPVMGVSWLFALGFVDVRYAWLLVVGSAVMTVGNLLLWRDARSG